MKGSFRKFSILCAGVLALSTWNCGSSSGTSGGGGGDSGGSPSITSVTELPGATDGVVDGSSSGSSLVRHVGASSTGIPFATTGSDAMTSDMSMAMCQMFNATKTAIFEAMKGDLIQCYITTSFEQIANEENIDLYDGQYHIFALNFEGSSFEENNDEEEGGSSGPDRIRVKFTKDSSGNITDFEMFACAGGEQDNYIRQTFSGSDFTMISEDSGTQGTEEFTNVVNVSATLNSSGAFVDEVNGTATPKVISMEHSYSNSEYNSDFWGNMTFRQFADYGTMSATFSGSNSWDDSTCTFEDVIFGSVGLSDVDPENNFGEMGDGAVKGISSGSCTGGQNADTWEDTFTEAWLGSTGFALDDSTASDYYDDVSDETLTAADEPDTFAYTDEWDCSGTPEATVVFANLDVDVAEACSDLEGNHNHIECWQLIGSEQQEEQQQNGPIECDEDADCSELGESGICRPIGQGGASICTITCNTNADCQEIDEALSCNSNVCSRQ